jgi:hypothetical protein
MNDLPIAIPEASTPFAPTLLPGQSHARPLAAAATLRRSADRRDARSRQRLLWRVRSEYNEMPGLRLTLGQAARLFGLTHDACHRVMNECVRSEWLRCTHDGDYVRIDPAP